MGTLSNGMVLNELYNLQCRIKELETENKKLREQLNNHSTTGNSERLQSLTQQFGVDEYPLE